MFADQLILGQIACEVKKIEAKLDHPDTGLVEIKKEIREIEDILEKLSFPILGEIKCEVEQIEAKLDNPVTGLVEIKREIRGIEKALDRLNLSAVLASILREVRAIEAKLDNPLTGLVEIKQEIIEITAVLNSLFFAMVQTSGPVLRRSDVNSVVVAVLNNTAVAQAVIITVFTFEPQCPKIPVAGSPLAVMIEPFCSFTGAFDVTANNNFEVQVKANVDRGIYAFASGRSEAADDPVFPSDLVGANVVLSSDFRPQFTGLNDC